MLRLQALRFRRQKEAGKGEGIRDSLNEYIRTYQVMILFATFTEILEQT